jgi:hypothetical protein
MAIAWNIISVGVVILAASFSAYFWRTDKTKVKAAVTVGILLSVGDFVLETIGKITGFWESLQGTFYMGFVPMEIMFITFFGGIMWSLMLPAKRHDRFSVVFMLVSILYGVFLESKLVDLGLFAYTGGWTSFHALAVYFVIIVLMHEAFYWAYSKYSNTPFRRFSLAD